jgi:hypothetical protein
MFKDDLTLSLNDEYAQKLIGRYIKGSDDVIGEISTVDLKYNSCEICINFSDGVRVLDTRHTIDYWLEKSLARDQLNETDLKQFRKRIIINNKK